MRESPSADRRLPNVDRESPRSAIGDIRRHAADAAELLKAMANPQRLSVLCALVGGPKSVGTINSLVPLSQSALSQHLAVLRESGLVTTRRESQTIHYALAHGPAIEILEVLHRRFCRTARRRGQ